MHIALKMILMQTLITEWINWDFHPSFWIVYQQELNPERNLSRQECFYLIIHSPIDQSCMKLVFYQRYLPVVFQVKVLECNSAFHVSELKQLMVGEITNDARCTMPMYTFRISEVYTIANDFIQFCKI